MYCYVYTNFEGLWDVENTEQYVGFKSYIRYAIPLDICPLLCPIKLK